MADRILDGGEAIVEAFRNLGIEYVMSSPGSEWGPVWEAFARQAVDKIEGPAYLNCGHETLAVDLAVGFTAVTGRMQAVLLHAGVGLMQGSMGIHGARLAGTPMIVMSGESLTYGDQEGFDPGAQWYTLLGIVGGPQKLAEPFVKWANQATSAATLYEMVIRAGELAQRSPTGPTYLNVPIETMLHPWRPPARLRKVPRAPKPQASAVDVERVAKLLASARNPVITTESCGREREGYEGLLRLAELLAIPVVENSVATVANFPKEHPLHQGFDGAALLAEADLVLVIRSRVPWYPPNRGPKNAPVVVIDECPLNTYMVYQNLQADLFLEGDVPSSLRMLAEAAGSGPGAETLRERRARWAAAHARIEQGYQAAIAKTRQSDAIAGIELCATLSEVLPKNAIYLDETTTHRRLNSRFLRNEGPQSFFRVPSGLGQCLGVSLGVKLACRERPVVALVGDGSFLYNPLIPSLAFAKEADLPILVVVYNNRGYRGMRDNHASYYPTGVGVRHEIFCGQRLNSLDYDELARPFGGFGIRVSDPAALKAALKEGYTAVAGGRTAIVNVVLEDPS